MTWITRNQHFDSDLSPRILWSSSVRPASVRQGWGHHASVSLPAGDPGEFPWFYMIWRGVVGGTVVGDWSFFRDLFLLFSLGVYLVSEVRRINDFRAEVSGDFLARLWKESQLPSQGGRWRAKITLLNISVKPAKAIQWQMGHQNVELKGPCEKNYRVFVKHLLGRRAQERRFGTFWWIHCPVGRRGTFRCCTRPWFWCLANREGAWTMVEHGGPVGYP